MKNRELILSLLVCACILMLLLPSSVLADSGWIPIGVTEVYEPGQTAIIAWDGENEILILAADVRADSETMALEIFPLPSQPDRIEQGDFDSFLRLRDLIEEHYEPTEHWWDCAHMEEEAGPRVEIVFHEKIGRHDIWVVKANDAGEFVQWAEDFLDRNEIEHQISSPGLESLVEQYIEEETNFFVFDLVEISPEDKSVEPIVYQFETDYLYYPLKISSIVPGYTEIRLFLLTPKPLELEHLPENELGGIRIAQAGEKPIQFELDEGELKSIDQSLGGLFAGHAWLTALESYNPRKPDVTGYTWPIPLESLDEDLKITEASFAEPPESSTPVWGWTVLGLVVLALGALAYHRYREAQLRRREEEIRKKAWERMQQR